MGYKDLLDEVDRMLRKQEEKYDEIPPWTGNKEEDDNETQDVDLNPNEELLRENFKVEESDDEIIISMGLPGISESDIDVKTDGERVYIEVSQVEDSETISYEYDMPEDAIIDDIVANYDSGLLEVIINRE